MKLSDYGFSFRRAPKVSQDDISRLSMGKA
jgi:hypothetical protein